MNVPPERVRVAFDNVRSGGGGESSRVPAGAGGTFTAACPTGWAQRPYAAL